MTLKKTVTNDNGGNNIASDWTLIATGSGGFNGQGTSVPDSEDLMAIISSDVTANVAYALSETGPDGYSASDYSCIVTQADGTVLSAVSNNSVTLLEGETAICEITNDDQASSGVTLARTQGFWSTHKEILIDHWNNDVVRTVSFGSHDLTNDLPNPTTNDGADDIPEVLGGFWSKIPRESDNDKRLPVIDQARMQLLQQLLAAILNEATFGTDYSDESSGNYITTAINIIDVETDKAVLITLAGNITFINEGGILGEQPLPAGFVLGEVDPKGAKIMADKAAWDDWP